MRFQEKMRAAQPHIHTTSIQNLSVESSEVLKVDGLRFPMAKSAFEDLRSMAKVSQTFANHADSYVGDGASARIVETLRAGISTQDPDLQVHLSVDKDEGSIRSIAKGVRADFFDGYFDILNRLTDRQGLEVTNKHESPNPGGFSVQLLDTDRQVNIENALSTVFEDTETFQAGLSLGFDPIEGVSIESFLKRLVCTNGMMLPVVEEQRTIKGINTQEMASFFEYVDELAKTGFMPSHFATEVDRASDVRASLYEVESLANEIRAFAKTEIRDSVVERHVPIQAIRQMYMADGMDPEEMTAAQRHNAATPLSVWDMINIQTDFASHTHSGVTVRDSDRERLMRDAGLKLMSNAPHDLENLVPMPSAMLN